MAFPPTETYMFIKRGAQFQNHSSSIMEYTTTISSNTKKSEKASYSMRYEY